MSKQEDHHKEPFEVLYRKRTRLSSNASDKNNRLQELQDMLHEEKLKNASLENRFEEVHHEMAVKSIEMEERIVKLKDTLRRVRNGFLQQQKPLKELEIVEDAHNKLQGTIKEILKDASELASIKENEIIKNFDSKLSEICEELENKRQKKNLEISMNKEKEEKYTAEAEMLKASANYIDSKNKTLEEQNKQLKIEFNARESEIRTLRKKISSLKSSQKSRPDTQSPFVRIKNPSHMQSIRSTSSDSKSQRYDSIVSKLKQMIEIEKSNLRAAKTAYTSEMEYKTEIEKTLRACVDDIKQEILKKKSQLKKGEIQGEKKILIDELLNAEDILNKIYDRAYPKSLLKR